MTDANVTIDHKATALRMSESTRLQDLALVHATLYAGEQQRIANKLQVALIDQLGEIAKVAAPASYPVDPSIRIRDYLTAEEWKELD